MPQIHLPAGSLALSFSPRSLSEYFSVCLSLTHSFCDLGAWCNWKAYIRTIFRMRTSPVFWLNRDKEEISCLMKLFLCPLPLWKIKATVFHYASVCSASHPSLAWDWKAVSVRGHPWSSHHHSWLQLSLLSRYHLKSVFQVLSPSALATICFPMKQSFLSNFAYFDLIFAYFWRVQSHIQYFIFCPLKKSNH